ncbi:MAG: type I-B CRISPR-associated endonuclease Cas1b [Candidatus Woesearchaeota archaeon]
MAENYYIFRSGKVMKKSNTLFIKNNSGNYSIPIKNIYSLYFFGQVSLNSKILSCLTKNKIIAHFFNYNGFYIGSYYPKEYLVSGFLLIKQAENYLNYSKRLELANEMVLSSLLNIYNNLEYYAKNQNSLNLVIDEIKSEIEKLSGCKSIYEVMAIEGRCREKYYLSFNSFLRFFNFDKRTRHPPKNEINALLSFGNSLLYTSVLTEIYKTQLNPTISYLHEPSERRFSLALDIADIFKPIIVDKIIFYLVNNRILDNSHFDKKGDFCYLNEKGRKIFVEYFDKKMSSTIYYKKLKRKVSFRELIRIELYKLIKHLIGENKYEGFKMRS